MEYNTARNKLLIPEYGRNVQRMIEYAVAIEDREKRTMVAKTIVNVMGQLNPQWKDSPDFKHKLWDHLFIISGFKLDVDSPFPAPSALTFKAKPKRVAYPSRKIQFKHYGKIMELMVDEAVKMEEGPQKDMIVETLANFMKMNYLQWNRDTVSDELIIEHLDLLSNGKLKLKPDVKLNLTSEILIKTNQQQTGKFQGARRNGPKSRSNPYRRSPKI